MAHRDFKYTRRFESKARFDLGTWREASASKSIIAKASLEDLRSLLPANEVIEDDNDLLYTAFNAAVVNLINANDHGIGTETALAVSKYFVKRHLNLEHDRNSVVGHIITQGFSSFGDNKILQAEEISGNDPFNICLGGIVYRYVRDYVAQFIEEAADEKSPWYQEVASSWEIGFNDFDIVLGSKRVKDAEIISNPEQVKEFTPLLASEGGEGFTKDGVPVYMLIKGDDARPVGCAFTTTPAAAVKGVLVASSKLESLENKNSQEIITLSSSILEKLAETNKTIEKLSISTSQNKIINVTKNSMKIKSIDQITPDFLKEAEASDVRDFITQTLADKASEFSTQVSEKETEKKGIQSELEEAKAKVTELESKVASLNDIISAKEKEEAFNVRMDEIDSTFKLTEEQKKSVASKIKTLDSDESYKTWKKEFSLFATFKGDEVDETESDDEEDEVKNLKEAKASKGKLPNAADSKANSDIDELASGLEILSFRK